MSSGGTDSPETISRIKSGQGDFVTVGKIDGIKVVQYKNATNAKIPRIAGDSSRYIVTNKEKELVYLTEYINHRLVREIDFDDSDIGIHAHSWVEKKTKKGYTVLRANKGIHEHLTDVEKELVKKIIKENKKRGLFKSAKEPYFF